MKITKKKNLLVILSGVLVLLVLAYFYYCVIFSKTQTELTKADTALLAQCISEQEDGAPYYAIYALCKIYKVKPIMAHSMLLIGEENNAFYKQKWPKESDIEKTFINIDAIAYRYFKDENKAKEAAKLCSSLKKIDNVISGAFPIDRTVKYSYSDTFGDERTYGGERVHEGVDIICETGTPVYSLCSGVVVKKGWNTLGGWRLLIRDEYNLEYYYAHLSRYVDHVNEGDIVFRGQLIGYTGDSGYGEIGTCGQFVPHLHFGIYENGVAVNPYFYIKQCLKNVQ